MTNWIEKERVDRFSQIKAPDLKQFQDEADLKDFIEGFLIETAQTFVNNHCKHDFETEYGNAANVPADVKLAVAMLCGNVLQWMRVNKMGSRINIRAEGISFSEANVLTPDIKSLLDHYKTSTPISISTDYQTPGVKDAWSEW